MDDNRVKTDVFQKDDIQSKAPLHPFFFHRASTILDHDGLIIKSPNIRKASTNTFALSMGFSIA